MQDLGARSVRQIASMLQTAAFCRFSMEGRAFAKQENNCREYNIPLRVAFVDYKNTFDAVQTQTILTSLQEQENTGENI